MIKKEGSKYDYAVLFLKENLKDRFYGNLKTNYEKKNCEIGDIVEIAGYPSLGTFKKTMFTGTGEVKSLEESFIKHRVPTSLGQSGSPIMNKEGEAIGIHIGGFGDSNTGIKLNRAVRNFIE